MVAMGMKFSKKVSKLKMLSPRAGFLSVPKSIQSVSDLYLNSQSRDCYIYSCIVRKKANIRTQYNQEPHLTKDITWESDKNTCKKTSQT